MSELLVIEKSVLVGIADAIRATTKKVDAIPVTSLASEVAGLAESGSITELIDRSIVEVEIAEGIEEIKDYVFYGCGSLERVVMPSSLMRVGAYAFAGCVNCLEYDFSRCTSLDVDDTSFEGLNANAKIYVPGSLYKSLIKAEKWYRYIDQIVAVGEIPEGWEDSQGLEFTYTDGIYTLTGLGTCEDVIVTVPATYNDGVNGEAQVMSVIKFTGMEAIREIRFGTPVNVQNYAFSGSNLVKVENIKIVGDRAFDSSTSLRYVRFAQAPNYITSIYMWSFTVTSSDHPGIVYDFRDCTRTASLSHKYAFATPGQSYIVVPDDLYSQWITATNWTYYSSFIIRASDAVAQGIVK